DRSEINEAGRDSDVGDVSACHLLGRVAGSILTCPPSPLRTASPPSATASLFTRRRGEVLHAERESKEVLNRIKGEISSLKFSAQYQQRPVPVEGNLIRRDWFRFYDQPPQRGPGGLVMQSWDIAHDDRRGQRLLVALVAV